MLTQSLRQKKSVLVKTVKVKIACNSNKRLKDKVVKSTQIK